MQNNSPLGSECILITVFRETISKCIEGDEMKVGFTDVIEVFPSEREKKKPTPAQKKKEREKRARLKRKRVQLISFKSLVI